LLGSLLRVRRRRRQPEVIVNVCMRDRPTLCESATERGCPDSTSASDKQSAGSRVKHGMTVAFDERLGGAALHCARTRAHARPAFDGACVTLGVRAPPRVAGARRSGRRALLRDEPRPCGGASRLVRIRGAALRLARRPVDHDRKRVARNRRRRARPPLSVPPAAGVGARSTNQPT